jgi:hypothetical protein
MHPLRVRLLPGRNSDQLAKGPLELVRFHSARGAKRRQRKPACAFFAGPHARLNFAANARHRPDLGVANLRRARPAPQAGTKAFPLGRLWQGEK